MRATKLLAVMVLVGAVACGDLDVTNPNNPNRVTVVRNSQDALALISNGLLQWFNRAFSTTPAVTLSVMADEFSTGFADFGGQDLSKEPRVAVNIQNPANGPPHHATFPDYYGNIAALNTALRAVSENDLVLRNSSGQDVTTEAVAYAKFLQGLNHGYVALMFDQGYIYSETVDLDTLPYPQGIEGLRNLIRPYRELMDTALAELDSALDLATANEFEYPAPAPNQWFLGFERTNDDLARLAHTYMARLMVYVARNPIERKDVSQGGIVDWNAVIQHIDQGITTDFEIMGTVDVVESSFKNRTARMRTTTPGDFMRVDYRVIGPADVSEGFRTWYARPWSQRTPFKMTTPDRRIAGAATRPATCLPLPRTGDARVADADCGLYLGYHNTTVFNIDRGTGQRSFYFFHRIGSGTTWQSGAMPLVNVAEMDLLKAEGLIRLGRPLEAIPLINKYRVTNGGLPAIVDETGVPGTAPNCVPRKLDGSCGSLWDALRYEKRIETLGVEGGPAYYDARGWGFLTENTPIHFPIPLRDLQLLELPEYTFGGAGGTDAAPAPDPERCPVALPRCTAVW